MHNAVCVPFTHNAFYLCSSSSSFVGKGLEAGCHNSFITLNISPPALSISLSTPHSLIPLFSHSSSSPPTVFIPPSCPLYFFFIACLPRAPVPLSFPHTSPWRTSGASLKVPIFLFLNNCHMPPCLTSRLACNDPSSLSLTVFPSPFTYTDTLSPPITSNLQRYNMPDNTKARSHARKISFYQSQQWLLTVQRINILKDKGRCARIHGEKGIRYRWSFAVCIPRIILQ